MRTAICIACLSLVITQVSIAEPLPRIGDTIDVAERDYFQLFPTISEFSEAVVTTDANGEGIAIQSHNPRQDVSVRLDEAERAELVHYLNDYEVIEYGKQKVDRTLLSDFIWYRPQPRHRGQIIDVEKTNGVDIRGRIFYVTDTTLLLVYPRIVPDWNDANTFARLSVDDIESIEKPKTNKLESAALGFLVGTGIGVAVAARQNATRHENGMENIEVRAVSSVVLSLVCGFGGAFAGLAYRSLQPKTHYDIRGSRDAFAHYHAQLERRARSKYLPPELNHRSSSIE